MVTGRFTHTRRRCLALDDPWLDQTPELLPIDVGSATHTPPPKPSVSNVLPNRDNRYPRPKPPGPRLDVCTHSLPQFADLLPFTQLAEIPYTT